LVGFCHADRGYVYPVSVLLELVGGVCREKMVVCRGGGNIKD